MRALQIGAKSRQTTFGDVDRGHVPTGGGELHRLAAGCGASVDRGPRAIAEQPCGKRGGNVLHPPGAIVIAREVGDRDAARQAAVTGKQLEPLRAIPTAQRQVEQRRGRHRTAGSLNHVFAPLIGPAVSGIGRQRGRVGQCRTAPAKRAEHAVDQLARAAIDQWQHGGDSGMARRAQRKHLGECDAQDEARLGVMRQWPLSRRIDQRVEIGQMPQHLGSDRAGERPVVIGANAGERAAAGLLDRLTPPQYRVEQPQRGLSRGNAGRESGSLGLVHA